MVKKKAPCPMLCLKQLIEAKNHGRIVNSHVISGTMTHDR